tara:strand:- start:1046 stop:2290 length:1245 start_codon:yes stop_codon:yes gene_type:complete
MNFFTKSLFFAIPTFLILIIIEAIVAKRKGKIINQPADLISSLSSGITNITKDGLKYSIVIVSYPWLLDKLIIYKLEPVWIAIFIAFIIQDFTGYWIHRLNHRVNIFWNRHVIHHSSEEFNLSSGLRQSISETFHFSAILMIPAALLGISHTIFIVLAPIHLFMQFWYHTRLINKMGWLEKIIVTPSHHRVHHAINPEYIDKNYGQIFIIWDKLFGSFQAEKSDTTPVYGILRPAKTWNPILINYKHLWQLIQDAYHTTKTWDKIRIWFMPTGWRPKDVIKKFPVRTINNPYKQSKYTTANSPLIIFWSGIQLAISGSLVLLVFSNVDTLGQNITTLVCLFVMINIFSYTALLDGSHITALFADGFKLAVMGSMLLLLKGQAIPLSIIIVFLYGILSTLGTIYFYKRPSLLIDI